MLIDLVLTAGGGFVWQYVPLPVWLVGGVILPPIAGVFVGVAIVRRIGFDR